MQCRDFRLATASLTVHEAQTLFQNIAALKARGVAIIYVSHKMSEIFSLSDRITILRDGKMRGTLAAADMNEDEVTRLMIGRSLDVFMRQKASAPGNEILRVEALTHKGRFEDVSFAIRKGEVLGL